MRTVFAFCAAAVSIGSIAVTALPSQAEDKVCIQNKGAYSLKAELHGTNGITSSTFTNPNTHCFTLDDLGTEVGDTYKLSAVASGGTTAGHTKKCFNKTRLSDSGTLNYTAAGSSSAVTCEIQ
jgi:hypothetical protein